MMDLVPLLISAGVGGAVGIALAAATGFGWKSGLLFGMDPDDLLTNGIIALVVASFIFLGALGGFVRDVDYPVTYPWKFTLETLLMTLVPVVPFVAMIFLRFGSLRLADGGEMAILGAKFGLLHVLLQFSGFYSYVL